MEESEEDRVRGELVIQLRESLAKSRVMMIDEKLDAKVREKWTQVHTNTAAVLNQVLRDRQFKDWERRLKEMEARRRKLAVSIERLETDRSAASQSTGGSGQPSQNASPIGGR